MVFSSLEREHASDTLEEIEPHVQRDIISSLSKEKVVQLINDMTRARPQISSPSCHLRKPRIFLKP